MKERASTIIYNNTDFPKIISKCLFVVLDQDSSIQNSISIVLENWARPFEYKLPKKWFYWHLLLFSGGYPMYWNLVKKIELL